MFSCMYTCMFVWIIRMFRGFLGLIDINQKRPTLSKRDLHMNRLWGGLIWIDYGDDEYTRRRGIREGASAKGHPSHKLSSQRSSEPFFCSDVRCPNNFWLVDLRHCTWYSVKRDLILCQKRPNTCQKRPNTVWLVDLRHCTYVCVHTCYVLIRTPMPYDKNTHAIW